jgi:hypothetical protein
VSGEDVARLTADVRRVMQDEMLYAEMSANCLRFVQTFHEKGIVLDKFEAALQLILEKGRLD